MSVHEDEVKGPQPEVDDDDGKVDMKAAALWYAERGYPVIPLHTPTGEGCSCGSGDCPSPGKHPRTRNGVKAATTSNSQIEQWWKKWPDANIGIATGRVVVLDVDGEAGSEWLKDRYLPESPRVVTGGGGSHIYFQSPGEEVGNAVLWSDGEGAEVRLKAEGGYVVAPPSLHESGERYEFAPFLGLDDVDLAPLPEWIKQHINVQKATVQVNVQDANFDLDPNATSPQHLFSRLYKGSSLFRKTWNRTREGLNDKSPSGYDMALSSRAAAAGWTDQDIVNLLIAHRRKHSDDLKLRPDYYQRTLAKARARLRRASEAERSLFAEFFNERGIQGATGAVRGDCVFCDAEDSLRVDFDRCRWRCDSCEEGGGTPEAFDALTNSEPQESCPVPDPPESSDWETTSLTCGGTSRLYKSRKQTNTFIAVRLYCGRWDCATCGKRLVEQWEEHLRGIARDANRWDAVRCAPGKWDTLRRFVRRRGGEYVRLNFDDHLYVFTNVDISGCSASRDHQELLPGERADRVTEKLRELPQDHRRVSTSRGWQLQESKDTKGNDSEWEEICDVSSSPAVIHDITEFLIERTGSRGDLGTEVKLSPSGELLLARLPSDWDSDDIDRWFTWLQRGRTALVLSQQNHRQEQTHGFSGTFPGTAARRAGP